MHRINQIWDAIFGCVTECFINLRWCIDQKTMHNTFFPNQECSISFFQIVVPGGFDIFLLYSFFLLGKCQVPLHWEQLIHRSCPFVATPNQSPEDGQSVWGCSSESSVVQQDEFCRTNSLLIWSIISFIVFMICFLCSVSKLVSCLLFLLFLYHTPYFLFVNSSSFVFLMVCLNRSRGEKRWKSSKWGYYIKLKSALDGYFIEIWSSILGTWWRLDKN